MKTAAAILVGAMIMTSSMHASTISVKDHGAAGDGIKDDTAAIQKALDAACMAGGGTVHLPAGAYLTSGSITVPSGVTLEGTWTAPHHTDYAMGSALLVVGGRGGGEQDPAQIELMPSSCVRGLTFFHPRQNIKDVQPYPYTIRGRGMNCSVTDVTLVNSYRGIDFGMHAHEMHYVRNVFGCVLRTGIFVDKCTDIGRIENVHINPHYWFRCALPADYCKPQAQAVIDYMNENLDAFVFGRTDWEYVLNTFAFAFKTCYKFIATPAGACNGNFVGIGADAGQYCVWVEATQPMGVQIVNGEFVAWPGDDSTQIVTTPSFNGVLQMSNCTYWGPSHRIARLEGPGHVSFGQCNFINCNKGPKSDSAFKVSAGTLQVNACRIAVDKDTHFEFGPDARSAIVTSNIIDKPLTIVKGDATKVVSNDNIDAPAKEKKPKGSQ